VRELSYFRCAGGKIARQFVLRRVFRVQRGYDPRRTGRKPGRLATRCVCATRSSAQWHWSVTSRARVVTWVSRARVQRVPLESRNLLPSSRRSGRGGRRKQDVETLRAFPRGSRERGFEIGCRAYFDDAKVEPQGARGVSLLCWRSGGFEHPTIRRHTLSRRHQLSPIAQQSLVARRSESRATFLRHLKGVVCARHCEFESSQPSHVGGVARLVHIREVCLLSAFGVRLAIYRRCRETTKESLVPHRPAIDERCRNVIPLSLRFSG
jgi:hypothetical protein